MGRSRSAQPAFDLIVPEAGPVIVRERGAQPVSWAPAVGRAESIVVNDALTDQQRQLLRNATCALVDGSGRNAVGLARQVRAADSHLQVTLVTSSEDRQRVERAALFAPGLGEVWFISPEEVSAALVESARTVTRQRRAYQTTQTTIEHDLSSIESQPIRRAIVSDAYLASLLAILPDPVISIDQPGTILSWNPAAQQVFGYTRTETVGKRIADILDPMDAAKIEGMVASASGKPLRSEIRFQRRNDDTGIGEITIVPVEAGGRRVFAIVVHDVTEERRVQERLETQAAELEAQASELEASQLELELANSDLHRANEELEASTMDAERARRDAEAVSARLEAVLRQMPSGVIVAEAPTGRLVLGNEQVDRIWRAPYHPAGSTGEYTIYRGFHPDGRAYSPEEWPLSRSLEGERVMAEEIEILRGDQTRGMITVSSTPIRNGQGDIIAAVAIFDDITEKKEQEVRTAFLADAGQVLASSLDYRQTLKSIARLAVPRIADWCAVDVLENEQIQRLAVAHSDPGRERLVHEIAERWPTNKDSPHGAARVLRTGESELIETISDDLLRKVAQDPEQFHMLRDLGLRSAMIVPLVARGRTLGAITFITSESQRSYDAHHLIFAEELASRAALAMDNARLFGAMQVAQEAAEEARKEAEAANRSKSEFLATMSHEIRTPINAIIGYTELLKLGLSGELTEKQAEQLERIRASSRHLLGLIEDILDLSKVEAGRIEVAHESARAVDAIGAALALVVPQATEKGIRIDNGCADDDGTLYVGDEGRVRQILVNLLSNAVKFTEQGGHVRITCGTTGRMGSDQAQVEEVRSYIRVVDTGIGIVPSEVERIFRPFEQVDKGHTRVKGGTGLGLTISRQLARLMGGDLTVDSQPGVGSAFTLWLPTEARENMLIEDSVIAQVKEERPPGLAAVGRSLANETESIIAAFRQRLRNDPAITMAAAVDDAQLEDHAPTLLADIAQSLIAMEKSEDLPEHLLRDGGDIQRMISDLHGRQRAQLGWSETAIRKELAILREEVENAVRSGVMRTEEIEGALALLSRFLDQAERTSLASLRRAID